jgi:ribosomal protein S18 acetylase RimI-like enzyme
MTQEETTSISITVRPASSQDVEFLFELYVSTRDGEFAFLPEAQRSQLLRLQFTAQQTGYASQFPESEQTIILNANEKVGRMWLARSEHEIRIIDIAILPEYRRLGIGRAAYGRVLSEAAAASKVVVASVLKSNVASMRFHSRCGFSVTGSDDMYYKVTAMPERMAESNTLDPLI